MLARTHFLGGIAAGVLTGTPVNVIISGVSSLLPDIDHANSWIGRRTPVVSWGIQALFGHRGIMHSLLGALLVGWLVPVLVGYFGFSISWKVVLAGYLSHLVLDTLTPSGVPWLWPLSWKIAVPLVRTGGGLEKVVVMPALFLLTGYLAWRTFL